MNLDLEQLKALAEAATKGPWKHYGLDGGHLVFEDAAGSSIASSIGRNHVGNAKYIAAANPERILALIAENERLAHSRKDEERFAWLVELKNPAGPCWATASGELTNDANKALNFSRKEDADSFISVIETATFGDGVFGIYRKYLSAYSFFSTEHAFGLAANRP